jgi:hypothetical protein
MELPVDILIVGNIVKDKSVLLRKKFPGSGPYKETWYSFGCRFKSGEDAVETFTQYISDYVGAHVAFKKNLFWDTEIKTDNNHILKQFVYLYAEFEYLGGSIICPENIEKVSFVDFTKLGTLDIVPPSVELFKKLEYLS